MRNVIGQKLQRKPKYTMYVQQLLHFCFENRVVYEIMWVKVWYSQTGQSRQYNAPRALCILDS